MVSSGLIPGAMISKTSQRSPPPAAACQCRWLRAAPTRDLQKLIVPSLLAREVPAAAAQPDTSVVPQGWATRSKPNAGEGRAGGPGRSLAGPKNQRRRVVQTFLLLVAPFISGLIAANIIAVKLVEVFGLRLLVAIMSALKGALLKRTTNVTITSNLDARDGTETSC